MSELTEELRDQWHPNLRPLYKSAAAEIEWLRAALESIAQLDPLTQGDVAVRIAERALEGK